MAARTGSPSSGRTSITGSTLPRRFITPTSAAGAPGTGVVTSSTTTSRVSPTSTAKGRPPSITTHARRAGARSATAAASTWTVASADKASHHREELVGRERLRQVVVGALPPAPRLVALLVLGRLAVEERHDLVAGAFEDRLHEL